MYSLAKIKRKTKNNGFFKLVSDAVFFDFDPDNYSLVDYSPQTLIEDGEFYKIENFSDAPFCPDWIKRALISTDYNDILVQDFDSIAYIFQVDDFNNISFQVAAKNVYLRKKTLLEFGEEVKQEQNKTILLIKEFPDAYYSFDADILIFRNLAAISKIFDGAASLYKEATSEEVKQFLSSPFIGLVNGFAQSNVSVLNRKKISICLDTFFKMNVVDQQSILNEIRVYKPEFYDVNTGQFQIDSDEALKFLLYGIQERYFTTPVSQEKRVANSVLKI